MADTDRRTPVRSGSLTETVLSLQRRAGNRAVARWWLDWFKPTWGTSRTTSPVSSVSPQTEMIRELRGETTLFKNAKVIAGWLRKRLAAGGAAGFTADEIFADRPTAKKLSPRPKAAAEIVPTLELMSHNGALSAGPAGFTAVLGADGSLATKQLDEAATKIGAFATEFEKRYPAEGIKRPVVITQTIDPSLSSDIKQRRAEEKARTGIEGLRAALEEFVVVLTPKGRRARAPLLRVTTDTFARKPDPKGGPDLVEIPRAGAKSVWVTEDEVALVERVKTGTHEATVKRRTQLETALANAEKALPGKVLYRTFAMEVVELLGRLAKRNTTWRAGTYRSHSWGEFSVDIFLQTSIYKAGEAAPGFWRRDVARQFFADLNTTAEEVGPFGKFAWRALYNDDPLRDEMNALYGAKRLSHVENHGPAPDHKLHIHLDLRPIDVQKDLVTGYDIDTRGRVVLR